MTKYPIEFLLYNMDDGSIQVILRDESIWATQDSMANLFGRDKSTISRHIRNIFSDGEVDRSGAVAIIATTASDGKTYDMEYYSLDIIISVGYRVNSKKATDFRIWATKVLREYIIKGFAMDDDRLKRNSSLFDKDYFEELLERVRSIRASERRIWQKITDIFAECSIDYDKDSPITRDFYAMVQNKFHYAITGKTAPEIVYNKADHDSENMGLSTWKNAPEGSIRKSDVTVAKNYLTEKQIKQLERTVSGYFDYIENLLERGNAFTMEEFSASVDKFLQFNEYKVLVGKGSISHDMAKRKAVDEYTIFNATQRYTSDFDKSLRKSNDDRGGNTR